MKLAPVLKELKRRKVYQVAAVYAAVGAAIALGVPDLFGAFDLPSAAARLVIVLVILGFPIALVLAWAYEVRPEEPGPGREEPPPTPVKDSASGWSGTDVSAETPGGHLLSEALSTPSAETSGPPAEGGKAAREVPISSVETQRPSIAVLPFENLSPDPHNAFFADGLTEEIIADLSKVGELRVISRTSAMVFKGTTKTVPGIARELNVRYALEGSVRREGESLRITAQLIDGVSDAHLWAEKYSGTVGDVFDLQEKLSRRIVDALKVTLTPEENRRLSARPIENVRAYDIWLRARQQALTMRPEGLDRARDLVGQALALAGENALLHATLSWIHAVRFAQFEEGAEEALVLAREHAGVAIELDPDLPWSLFSMAAVHHREADLQGFVRWGLKALEIERDSHTLAVLSLYLAQAGRMEAARRYAEEAASLDPLSWLTTHSGPHADVYAGEAERGFEGMRELATRLAPEEPWPAFEVGYAALQAGLEEEARAWLRLPAAGGTSPFYRGMGRLLIHVLDGNRTGAEEILGSESFLSLAGRIGEGSYLLGACLARLERPDDALKWLDRAVDQWFTNHRFMAEYDPLLASLRGMQGFEAVLERAREMEAGLDVEIT